MNKKTPVALFLIVSLVFELSSEETKAQTNADSIPNRKKGAIMVVVDSLEVNEKALNLVYDIRNTSADDAWVS